MTAQTHPHQQTVINRAILQNHTITDQDVSTSQTLREVAINYVDTCKSDNSFMQSLKTQRNAGRTLSVKQMRVALSIMIGEAKRSGSAPKTDNGKGPFYVDLPAIKAASNEQTRVQYASAIADALTKDTTAKAVDISDGPDYEPIEENDSVPNGIYTVLINDDGDYRTIRLRACPSSFDKPAGTQIAEYLSGSDNDSSYTGFAFVNADRYAIWKKFKNDSVIAFALTKLLAADHLAFGRAYALKSGKCFICNRTLTTPDSIKAGIGPVCAEKIGTTFEVMRAFETPAEKQAAYAEAQAAIDELFPE